MHTKHVSLRHSLPVPFDQARSVLPVVIPASSGACCFTLFPDVSIISLCFRREGVGAAAGTTGGAPARQTTRPHAVVVVVAGQDVNGLDLRLARFTSSLQPASQIMEHAASVLVELLPERKKNMSWNASRLVDYSVDIYHNMEKCCCVRKME